MKKIALTCIIAHLCGSDIDERYAAVTNWKDAYRSSYRARYLQPFAEQELSKTLQDIAYYGGLSKSPRDLYNKVADLFESFPAIASSLDPHTHTQIQDLLIENDRWRDSKKRAAIANLYGAPCCLGALICFACAPYFLPAIGPVATNTPEVSLCCATTSSLVTLFMSIGIIRCLQRQLHPSPTDAQQRLQRIWQKIEINKQA